MEHVLAYIYYTYGQGESGGLLPELPVDAIDEVVVQKHLSVFFSKTRTVWRHTTGDETTPILRSSTENQLCTTKHIAPT